MPGVPINADVTEKREISEELKAREYLKNLAEKLQIEKQLRVAYDTVIGAAGPTIVTYCEEQDIELVAIATMVAADRVE